MNKVYYAEVVFNFNTKPYSFITHDQNFKFGDRVLCEVRNAYQIGVFLKYINPTYVATKRIICNVNEYVKPIDFSLNTCGDPKKFYTFRESTTVIQTIGVDFVKEIELELMTGDGKEVLIRKITLNEFKQGGIVQHDNDQFYMIDDRTGIYIIPMESTIGFLKGYYYSLKGKHLFKLTKHGLDLIQKDYKFQVLP